MSFENNIYIKTEKLLQHSLKCERSITNCFICQNFTSILNKHRKEIEMLEARIK